MRILYGLTAIAMILLTAGLFRIYDGKTTIAPSGQGRRFSDIGDGTIIDNRSGLIWLKDVGCLGSQNWQKAQALCQTLASGNCGLRDDSRPGRWRLPRLEEIRALLDPSDFSPVMPHNHPFIGISDGCYWATSGQASTLGNPRKMYIGHGGAGLGGINICESRYQADPDAHFFFLAVRALPPN